MELDDLMEALWRFKDENELSYEDIARGIGTTGSTVFRWRQGSRTPRRMACILIRDYLKRMQKRHTRPYGCGGQESDDPAG